MKSNKRIILFMGNYSLSRDMKAISSEFMEVSAMNPKVVIKKLKQIVSTFSCLHAINP